MSHWANIGGSASAQYPTDLYGGVTTTAGSAAFAGRLAGHQYTLKRLTIGGRHASASHTILIKDHAATATYATITVAPATVGQEQTLDFGDGLPIPVGGIQTTCSDAAVTAIMQFETEKRA